jgi:hypothetical protein
VSEVEMGNAIEALVAMNSLDRVLILTGEKGLGSQAAAQTR